MRNVSFPAILFLTFFHFSKLSLDLYGPYTFHKLPHGFNSNFEK